MPKPASSFLLNSETLYNGTNCSVIIAALFAFMYIDSPVEYSSPSSAVEIASLPSNITLSKNFGFSCAATNSENTNNPSYGLCTLNKDGSITAKSGNGTVKKTQGFIIIPRKYLIVK